MPFEKGNTLSKAGRPKGIKDKRTKFYDVQAQLESSGFDPINALIQMAEQTDDLDVRFKATRELKMCIAPTLKTIEHKGDTEMASDLAELKAELKAQAEKYKRDH